MAEDLTAAVAMAEATAEATEAVTMAGEATEEQDTVKAIYKRPNVIETFAFVFKCSVS